jgi:parallel beta-helix repeat protein
VAAQAQPQEEQRGTATEGAAWNSGMSTEVGLHLQQDTCPLSASHGTANVPSPGQGPRVAQPASSPVTTSHEEGRKRGMEMTRSMTARTSAALGMLAAILVVPARYPAHATELQCGDTVTHSITLQDNLICPSGFPDPALTVAAHNVRIDLNGHAIVAAGRTGIVNDGYRHLRVENGALPAEGPTSIDVRDATNVTLRDLRIGVAPVRIHGSHRIVLEGNHIDMGSGNWSRAVDIRQSTNVTVRNNPRIVAEDWGVSLIDVDGAHITSNLDTSVFVHADRTVVSDNTVRRASGAGIVISGDRNTVRNNHVHGAGTDGIRVSAAATHTRIESNVASNNEEAGIRVATSSATLRDNAANDNNEYGIWAEPGVRDLGGNTAEGNDIDCINVDCG